MRFLLLALGLATAQVPPALADAANAKRITDEQILPGMAGLAASTAKLADAARADCRPGSSPLRAAYGEAFDDWIAVSHFRFGPTETDNRAFALAFWPDTRGKTPKALQALIAKEDPSITDPAGFAAHSIAARGFYALEYLLYDPALAGAGSAEYRCALAQAISADIAATAGAISTDWQQTYAAEMETPGGRYQTQAEIDQELFKALTTGLQVAADLRLGRPLGTFDKPRPKRAEAYRSGRSLRHVVLSLEALQPLALALAQDDPALVQALKDGFARPLDRAAALDDPVLAGVSDPAKRFRIEALQQDINDLRTLVAERLGPALGVEAGFNSLDGD